MELRSSVERALGECPFEFPRYRVRACTGVLVHRIFRFDADGQIIEHWDAIQEVPNVTRNGNPMY